MDPTLDLFATQLESQVQPPKPGSSAAPDICSEGGAAHPRLPSSLTGTFRVWFIRPILDAYLCMRRIIAENDAYVWPNDPHPCFPFGQGDIWWVANLKAVYKVPHFPIWLNVLYFKDCELHTSCVSRSDLGNLAVDSSGGLASKSQLLSPKVIQCLNDFKLTKDSNFHNSISQMLS